jgi:hypothetical protein
MDLEAFKRIHRILNGLLEIGFFGLVFKGKEVD